MTPRTFGRGPRRAVKSVLTVLLVASFVSGVFPVAAAWPPWAEDAEGGRGDIGITVEWLAEHRNDGDVAVVDVRPRSQYDTGHIPGAVHVDVEAASLDDGPSLLSRAGLSGDERIVFYGAASMSERAALAFWMAEYWGATRASVLEGGLAAWLASGGPTTADAREPESAGWVTAARPERAASTAYVAVSFGVKGREVLDARGWDDWSGEPRQQRTGHIPQSLPLASEAFLESGVLMSPEASREMLSRFGPRPSNPVDLSWEFIVHGEGARDGAVLYYLLRRAGVGRVRLYADGWSAWVADAGLPVVRVVGAQELRERLARERRWFAPESPPPGFAVFDVRHWSDYRRGHIPGSVNLTSRVFGDSLDIVMEKHWPDFDRLQDPIVTYCYGPDCIRSRATSTVAARRGFLVVERLYEGLQGWRSIGAPVTAPLESVGD